MTNAGVCPNGHCWQDSSSTTLQTAPVACPVCGAPLGTGIREAETLVRTAPEQVDEAVTLGPGTAPTDATGGDRESVPGYEVLGVLGRGGMGVVYKARHLRLGRLVALKMVLAGGHAGPSELARFRTEAESVARLQHPGIVQIFEVGEHQGLPYLSLEYCSGGSVERLLNGTPLPARQAAELVERLARAMHAAHQANIIHRDLKPANILLQVAEGALDKEGQDRCSSLQFAVGTLQAAIPKITDFGLAKRLDEAGQTGTGTVVGTPSYMAPEQADGKNRQLGPAVDIYALGAVLYELLTGRPPFKAATPLDTILQVVSDEPVSPSHLQPRTPRDLETICLTCLRKEPSRRYASAAALADDLGRFREDRPIAARPSGPIERAGKWARRRPTAAALAVASALAVLILTMGGVLFTRQVRAERDRAQFERGQADIQRRLAEDQTDRADRARQEAVEGFLLAREAVDRYATRVSESLKLRQEDLRPLRKQLLETVIPFYEKLVQRDTGAEGVRAEQARAYERLAAITGEIGDKQRAVEQYQKARELFGDLATARPDAAEYQSRLGSIHNELAGLYESMGQGDKAEASFREGISVWRRLVDGHPGNPVYQVNLASLQSNLAHLYTSSQRFGLAEELMKQALVTRQRLLTVTPGELAFRHNLAKDYINLGIFYATTRRLAQAAAEFQKAVTTSEALDRDYPKTAEYLHTLVVAYSNLGAVHNMQGRPDQSEACLQQVVKRGDWLVEQHPSVTQFAVDLANLYNNLGTAYKEGRHKAEAPAAFRRAIALQELVSNQHPLLVKPALELAGSCCNLGHYYRDVQKPDQALPLYVKAVGLLEAIRKREPRQVKARQFLLNTHYGQAMCLTQLGRAEEACKEWEAAAALAEGPQRDDLRSELGGSLCNVGAERATKGKWQEALSWYGRAVDTLDALATKNPGDGRVRAYLADSLAGRATSAYMRGRYSQSLRDWDRAIDLDAGREVTWRVARADTRARLGDHERAAREAAELGSLKELTASHLYDLARVHALAAGAAAGDLPTARSYADRAVELLRRAAAAGHFKKPQAIKRVRNDPDLKAIQAHAAFQKLIKEWSKD
jgi:tetratricopeptide (TPR) repeat protein